MRDEGWRREKDRVRVKERSWRGRENDGERERQM